MAISKIYLGKSNKANPDHLMAVREMLKRFDVEVVEYNGGTYSHIPMLGCDKLFIVPDLSDYDEDEDYIGLGKGLHEQINAWHSRNDEYDDEVYAVVNPGDDYYLRRVTDLDVTDVDDYVNYSYGMLDYNYSTPMLTKLTTFFGKPKVKEEVVTKTTDKKYSYLLCSK